MSLKKGDDSTNHQGCTLKERNTAKRGNNLLGVNSCTDASLELIRSLGEFYLWKKRTCTTSWPLSQSRQHPTQIRARSTLLCRAAPIAYSSRKAGQRPLTVSLNLQSHKCIDFGYCFFTFGCSTCAKLLGATKLLQDFFFKISY